MHLRIHCLLLVVLLGYSSTTYAQQTGSASPAVAGTEEGAGDEALPVAEAAVAQPLVGEASEHAHAAAAATDSVGSWAPRDDIYIDDEDEDDDEWEGSGVSTGRGRGGSNTGSRRGGKGGGSRDDLESSGSGAGPLRRPGHEDVEEDPDEDREEGSGGGIDVSVEHIPGKKSDKKPYTPPIEPKEEVKKVPEVSSGPNKEDGRSSSGNDIDIVDPNVGTADETPVEEEDKDDVYMNKTEERATSFFSQPGILAAVIGGAVVGLLCAILVVMFIVYRMRKKDEGSYALDEPKRSPTVNSYTKNSNREFYA